MNIFVGHEGGINGVAWAPNLENLPEGFVSVGNDKKMILWNINNDNGKKR